MAHEQVIKPQQSRTEMAFVIHLLFINQFLATKTSRQGDVTLRKELCHKLSDNRWQTTVRGGQLLVGSMKSMSYGSCRHAESAWLKMMEWISHVTRFDLLAPSTWPNNERGPVHNSSSWILLWWFSYSTWCVYFELAKRFLWKWPKGFHILCFNI